MADDRPLRFLTMDELNALLRWARGTVYHDIIYVLVRTGVRAGELAALRSEDVDLGERVVRVGGRREERLTALTAEDAEDAEDGGRGWGSRGAGVGRSRRSLRSRR